MIGFSEVFLSDNIYDGTAQEIYDNVSNTCKKIDAIQIMELPKETKIIYFKMFKHGLPYSVVHTSIGNTTFKHNEC